LSSLGSVYFTVEVLMSMVDQLNKASCPPAEVIRHDEDEVGRGRGE